MHHWPGSDDIDRAVAELRARLPEPLHPLATLAYNYHWSWSTDGGSIFSEIDPHQWVFCGLNPVRQLHEASSEELRRAASNHALIARAREAQRALFADLERPPADGFSYDRPVAFFCSELGIHSSLPLYSGGLGVLAGDLVKEASDSDLPMVAVSLLYRYGYFQQRADTSGLQHEYWIESDSERLPLVRVTRDGQPLRVEIELWGRPIALQIWRASIGRVPLYLLDAEVADNTVLDRWLTARLYDGNRTIRLGQYALLGIAGVRALGALGIAPGAFHLNEGHAVLAGLELAARETERGASFDEAIAAARERIVFTTHTPVPAGNETYPPDDLFGALPELPARLGATRERIADLGRTRPGDPNEPVGLTPLALRTSRHTNGVSQRHGEVARSMWHSVYPGHVANEVPISAITNGVHLPTWMGPDLRALFAVKLGAGWERRAAAPAVWKEALDAITDEELWAARNRARANLIEFARERSLLDRLRRGEPIEYVQAAANALDADTITLGFARRLASYKRLNLIVADPRRALALLESPRPIQLLMAGKAHPLDDGAKRIVQSLFELKSAPGVAQRVAFLENYGMALAARLVSGCDVWVNLPRPPLEASGTSGMKAALNGGLNLSTLDGWWAEAYDGTNGWGIDGSPATDEVAQDARDAAELYRILEDEVVPLFYDRDETGIPRGWVARIRASLATIGPRFCTTRALGDYMSQVYRPG